MKKIIAMLLALMLLLSLSATAFAADNTPHTITVNNGTSDFTYEAYQIFKGTVEKDEATKTQQLTNIQWGSSIKDPTALITALQAIDGFADCTTAVDVAAALNGKTDDADLAKAFAAVVGDATFANGTYTYTHLKDDPAGTSTYSKANKVYTIPVTGDGYYLVLNSAVPNYEQKPDGEPTESEPAYTRYILTVVDDITINHKGNVPTLEKKIIEDGNEVSANTAEIGEVINYKITATMPSNIADYKTYYFKFNDYLSEGLTYQDDIKITVNGVDVYKNGASLFGNKGFHVQETTNTTGNDLTAAIADLKALENDVGDITSSTKVVITYTAVLNEKAVVGVNGNPNLVNLVYSNDPNYTGNPTTDPFVPTPNSPVGETPYDRVITYTTEIQVKKIDATTKEALTGAKFSISGFSTKVKIINGEMFIPYAANQTPEEGNVWYRLKDGTYTQTAPVSNDENPDDNVDPVTVQHYDDPTKTYKKVTTLVDQTFTEDFTAEGWVKDAGENKGIITFTGLGAGTYTIEEIVAPNGYNLLEDEITVVITSNVATIKDPAANTKVTWTAELGEGNTAKQATIKDGIITFEVENQSGSTLPSTGGMGTTIFYIIGGIMVLAAVVLLVTKKRMSVTE